MRCAPIGLISLVLVLAAAGSQSVGHAQTPPPQTAPPAAAPAKPPQTPPAVKPPARQTASSARLAMSVLVTATDGKTLPEVWVKASGPVDREASTDPSGNVSFTNMAAGTYRLRFEHDRFVTFEREVTLAAGKPARVTVTLNAAPPPPPAPKPEPAPVTPATPAPAGDYKATAFDIPDFYEKNFNGRNAVKRASVGCTADSSSTLIELRDPLAEHTHADQDELIYVVAGEGVHKVGTREHALAGGVFAVVPRGTPHSITRKGRQPLLVISTLTGTPCSPEK
jgi:mannose-6-phosphate isomerase-like protein (cupin superfamily)